MDGNATSSYGRACSLFESTRREEPKSTSLEMSTWRKAKLYEELVCRNRSRVPPIKAGSFAGRPRCHMASGAGVLECTPYCVLGAC